MQTVWPIAGSLIDGQILFLPAWWIPLLQPRQQIDLIR